MTRRVANKQKK